MKCCDCGYATGDEADNCERCMYRAEIARLNKQLALKRRSESNLMSDKNYTEFIRITVILLLRIRDNPTTAKIDNLLIDLQSLALDQESI